MGHYIFTLIGTIVLVSRQCTGWTHPMDPMSRVQYALSHLEDMIQRMDTALQDMHVYRDEYSQWYNCTLPCGIGEKKRHKIDCDTFISDDCVETMYCNAHPCPVEPKPKKVRYATCSMRPDQALGSSGAVNGLVTFRQEEKGSLVIDLNVTGFDVQAADASISQLEHGFHVHEYGDLSGGCGTAGGHFNPKKVHHGGRLDSVRHIGDLGNIRQTPEGDVIDTIVDERASLFGDHSIIGRALVIHRDQDDLGQGGDEGSETTGNAGPRLACCVIGVATEG